jgi:isoleucyl-tRNA synthetase
MHKSAGNSIEFGEAADRMGVDVMRWMYCSHKPEQNLLFGYRSADETRRQFLIPLWNVYSFFVTYANLDGWTPSSEALRLGTEAHALDRWILTRLGQTVLRVTESLEQYDAYAATLAVEPLLDDLTNWYVRRSRRRFWKSEHDADKDAAYATLYRVLMTMCKLLAPFVPFVTEAMYQNLRPSGDPAAPECVHHCDWPTADPAALDQNLLERMALAMEIAALGRSARSASNVKLRQPLARALVYAGNQSVRLDTLAELVTDELNVKELQVVAEEAALVEYEIGLLPNILGPKHGRRFPLLRKAVAEADAAALARRFRAGQSVLLEMEDGGEAVEILPAEVEVRSHGRQGFAVAVDKGVVVAIDITLTPELEGEGLARDLVRRIQTMRKDADLQLSDRIVVFLDSDPDLLAVVEEWRDYIQGETLSRELVPGPLPPDQARRESFSLEGHQVSLGVRRA